MSMSEKRITVWVQHFKDRPYLVLQWIDPDTGQRKSRSAKTADPTEAEDARADLEYELTHGKYLEASRMTWERFRELFEAEYVATTRPATQSNYQATFDLFEKVCHPNRLASISERTISLFAAGMRKEPGRSKGTTMMASSIKVRLQFLHTALSWATEQKLLHTVPKFPVVKVLKKDPQPVPLESFERLLAKAPDANMRAFLLCGWLAGLRLSEALALEWEECDDAPYLDLGRNRIVLPGQMVKAVKDQWVPLDPALRQVLEALPQHGRKVFRFRNYDGQPLGKSAVCLRVCELAKKAGVRLTMKSLRRGFGCRYAGKVSAHVLQKLMRHANIKTTMDYYANIDQAVEEAVLGPQRNSLRNSQAEVGQPDQTGRDVTTSQDSTSFHSVD